MGKEITETIIGTTMGIFDWWIDKTVKNTCRRVLDEKLPAMIDDEIDRQAAARGLTRREMGFLDRGERNA